MNTPSDFIKASICLVCSVSCLASILLYAACGTGALVVSYVVRQVMGYDSPDLTVLHLRYVWHDPDAANRGQQTDSGWRLSTRPVLLFEGTYQLATKALDSGEPCSVLEEGADA